MWVRGLKISRNLELLQGSESHPMWVRGLKQIAQHCSRSSMLSHPMWVRGLKHGGHRSMRRSCQVAPYVGAWIETLLPVLVNPDRMVAPYVGAWIETSRNRGRRNLARSHPMWVRGLKLRENQLLQMRMQSHPMWVRGLKLQSG